MRGVHLSAFSSVASLKAAIRQGIEGAHTGYTIEQVTTSAHGTYWVMVAPDGLHFGPRMFSEEEALHELAEYAAHHG